MSRVTKWMAVAVLAVTGLAFSGATAGAAERATPVQTAYRSHRGGYHGGGYHGGWNHGGGYHGGWNHGGWNHGGWWSHNSRWYRR
ncbi:MAG: hypothetical protein JWO38_623 [Gemmataceae bacterium]|nr:hypothetical protein [Gemmataceae bacterium]